MSSPERKAQRQAEFDAEDQKRRAEDYRKEKLSMWERIEEADASEDVKDILHRITTFLVLE
jgi:thymidylate kinase